MINEIRKAVTAREDSETRGEEGLLYKVKVPDIGEQVYWAKKWYRTGRKGFSMPFEVGGSLLSPFWHKLIELEGTIVHELFPNETIDTIGSYDERIRSGIAIYPSFNIMPGRPVTVSRETIGDPEITATRDEIMKHAYAVLLRHRDQSLRMHGSTSDKDPFFDKWRKDINREMVRVLGPEISLDDILFKVMDSDKLMNRLVENLRRRNPENIMADFFEAGISLSHPEVNFIPGSKDAHPRPPHGTFVEFAIADVEMLKGFVNQKYDGPKRDKLLQKIQSYELHKLVDSLYDRIFLFYMQKVNGDFNSKSLSAISASLDKLLLILQKRSDVIDITEFERAFAGIIMTSRSHEEMAQKIERELIATLDHVLKF